MLYPSNLFYFILQSRYSYTWCTSTIKYIFIYTHFARQHSLKTHPDTESFTPTTRKPSRFPVFPSGPCHFAPIGTWRLGSYPLSRAHAQWITTRAHTMGLLAARSGKKVTASPRRNAFRRALARGPGWMSRSNVCVQRAAPGLAESGRLLYLELPDRLVSRGSLLSPYFDFYPSRARAAHFFIFVGRPLVYIDGPKKAPRAGTCLPT